MSLFFYDDGYLMTDGVHHSIFNIRYPIFDIHSFFKRPPDSYIFLYALKTVNESVKELLMFFFVISYHFSASDGLRMYQKSDMNFILIIFVLLSLNNSPATTVGPGNIKSVRVVFWNVENLYDTYDDTTRLDNEFTPGGMMRWNYTRFHSKINHVTKTLLALGQWEPPGIIGFCEVENRYVMNKLIYESPLKPYGYRMIHHESPDLRGIDVALLYRPSVFQVIDSKPFKIRFPFDTSAQTREILLVKGVVHGHDTLNLLINHWPSRRGGYAESQPRRDFVASVLKHIADSLQSSRPGSKILIMGDFNDEPTSASITNILHAIPPDSMRNPCDLVNLMQPMCGKQGSHRYKGIWSLLDQFMISGSLFIQTGGLHLVKGSVTVYKEGFLLKDDLKYFGSKPFRTFNGFRYEGGFSDHLPVYLDLAY